MPDESEPQHLAPETSSRRRRRVVGSFAWMAVFDADLARLWSFWFGAVFGVIFVVVGIVNGLAWLLIGGAVMVLVSVGMILLTRWMTRVK